MHFYQRFLKFFQPATIYIDTDIIGPQLSIDGQYQQ